VNALCVPAWQDELHVAQDVSRERPGQIFTSKRSVIFGLLLAMKDSCVQGWRVAKRKEERFCEE
jgi:hypothetical protein